MTRSSLQSGGCACRGVRFRLFGELRDVYNCHCERCRRITGHYLAATAVHTDQIAFDSDLTLSWYDPVQTVHYGFCKTCGSTLFWKTDEDPDKLCIAAGTLDQPTGLRTTKAWYVAGAGDYHDRQQGLADFDLED